MTPSILYYIQGRHTKRRINMITLIQNADQYRSNIAIQSGGKAYTYSELLNRSASIAAALLGEKTDLNEERIAFIVDPGYDYTAIQWGIWRAGGIAVPLCIKHPLASIRYVVEDTKASVVIYTADYAELISPLSDIANLQMLPLMNISDSTGVLPDVDLTRRAMILYTSGTTGLPKGVVTTHANIEAQITSLTTSWQWSSEDHILNVLPMHHVHGIINVMSCALWSGACCEFLPKFDTDKVFDLFTKGALNLFMAVPTIYYKLIAAYNEYDVDRQRAISEALPHFRLMVSGSAALPISVLEQWKEISGQMLLERYGMTEMGMAISNPYDGERKRGHIGQPLAGVTVRLVDEENNLVTPGTSGEIQVKGPNVFNEYWGKPEATADTFTYDGWFKTGDIAAYENDSYRILGRNSVDIIKSGGYKISALEIEEILRTHPMIKDCGVVGVPDDEWGEIVAASLIVGENSVDFQEIKNWLKDKLPGYKIPRKYIIQDDLPRNVMGKVTKKELTKLF